MEALVAGRDAAAQMIDTSVLRVHQHGACIADNAARYDELATNYLAFVKLASIRIWLGANESTPLGHAPARLQPLRHIGQHTDGRLAGHRALVAGAQP
jgi:hypothetical protein